MMPEMVTHIVAVVEFTLGAIAGTIATWLWVRSHRSRREARGTPADLHHTLDLLRRATEAEVACSVSEDDEDPVVATGNPRPSPELIDKTIATAKLALGDGRMHINRDDELIVAVGDGTVGAAISSGREGYTENDIDDFVVDLRRIVAGLRVQKAHSQSRLRRGPSDNTSILNESVDGMALALCEAACALTDRPTAVVVRDITTRTARIEAVSHGVDRRLLDMNISTDSAVGRACSGDAPVVGDSGKELFGTPRDNRRKHEDKGTAFPLRDGREGVGALVVFGSIEDIDPGLRERVMWLAIDAGPRLASAAAIRAAEKRAMTDELTGLPNRRALDRAVATDHELPCSMLALDLDHFKRVNDTFGHAAGDSALQHVSKVVASALQRENDLVARIGGEEFAVWLPGAPKSKAVDMGETIRAAVEGSPWHWAGSEIRLTLSAGVASCPDSVSQIANLYTTADAALYRAKELGRNRVEAA
jgi:diguanylate cyclase (GGDEF)-like protein